MIAAIYARKSTEQAGVSHDEKSVTRQVHHANVYAAKKGWVVAEEHIYVDDGISGAEFVKRPGFLRLMNSLKPKPPFQILIMSEESRLGRESIETAYALKQIITAGIRVFFYLEDRERTLESPIEKVMLSLTAFADELEREKARQRTHDAMLQKAKALHVTGGHVFGYDNVDVASAEASHGRPRRLHVVRRVNETEAAVVRQIFELCAAGKGITRIAKLLNEQAALTPRPRTGRVRAWAPSSVREILYRPLYRGEPLWNKTRKRDHWGIKRQRPRPEAEWLKLSAPELRIVSEELWKAAHDRLEATKFAYLRATSGQLWGRPASGIESKYLLTGLAQCSCCGGSLCVRSRSHGRRRVLFYGCTSYHLKGGSVCKNNLEAPMDAANREVLSTIEKDLLRPEVIKSAIMKALDRLKPADNAIEGPRHTLTGELEKLDQELMRLAAAIASGGELPALLATLKDRERRHKQVKDELAALEQLTRVSRLDLVQLERDLEARLQDWQGLLGRHVIQARQILGKLLVGRLTFAPKINGAARFYEFTGQGSLGRLLFGIVFPKGMVAPTGFEPVFLD